MSIASSVQRWMRFRGGLLRSTVCPWKERVLEKNMRCASSASRTSPEQVTGTDALPKIAPGFSSSSSSGTSTAYFFEM
eukprot:3255534-Karenia_brevis.AAC.1